MPNSIISVMIFAVMGGAAQMAQAQAAFAKPADAIKYRQGVFQVMGFHSQRLGSMVKNERPYDKSIAQNDASLIEMMSRQLDAVFPAGSDMVPSKARHDVWQNEADFKQKLEEFKAAAQKLNTAARSGDVNLLKAAFSATAQSCKACHEDYRLR